MSGYLLALGPCYLCGAPFSFDPDTVPSVMVDERTNAVATDDTPAELRVRKQLCDDCVERIEALRKEQGLTAHWPRRAG
jgi:hypothetical protein